MGVEHIEDTMYTHFVQWRVQLDPTWFCLQTKSPPTCFVVNTSPPTTPLFGLWIWLHHLQNLPRSIHIPPYVTTLPRSIHIPRYVSSLPRLMHIHKISSHLIWLTLHRDGCPDSNCVDHFHDFRAVYADNLPWWGPGYIPTVTTML